MKKSTPYWIAIALLATILLAIGIKFIVLGSAAIKTMGFKLRTKLPLAFKKFGFATHYAFDEIDDMAKTGKFAKEVQQKLAATMNNCTACHTSYQLPVLPSHP